MNLTEFERESYFAMDPKRCILYRQVHCEVIGEDSPSPTRFNGGQLQLGPHMAAYESFLDLAYQGDERLKELIANRTTVPLARPEGVEMCGTPKSMVDERADMNFEFIDVMIVSTGDWPTLTRRLNNIRHCGIISPTREERAAIRRKIDEVYVNPNEVNCEQTPPKLAKQDQNVKVPDRNADSLLDQLGLEFAKESAIQEIFEEDLPAEAQSSTASDSVSSGLHPIEEADDQNGADDCTSEIDDSYATLMSANQQLRRTISAQARELSKMCRRQEEQRALLQRMQLQLLGLQPQRQPRPMQLGPPHQQPLLDNPPPPQQQRGQQRQQPVLEQQRNAPQQQRQNAVLQQQHHIQHLALHIRQQQQPQPPVAERGGASPPVAAGSVWSYVRKAYYPLPTGDYVLSPNVVRHCPSTEYNAFAGYMLVNVFERAGLRQRRLYAGSLESNTVPARPALDTHRMNAILNLCWEKFGLEDPRFEGKFGNAARNKLPRN